MHLAAAYLSLACRLEPGPALQLLLARRGLAANEAAHKLPQAICSKQSSATAGI